MTQMYAWANSESCVSLPSKHETSGTKLHRLYTKIRHFWRDTLNNQFSEVIFFVFLCVKSSTCSYIHALIKFNTLCINLINIQCGVKNTYFINYHAITRRLFYYIPTTLVRKKLVRKKELSSKAIRKKVSARTRLQALSKILFHVTLY